MVSNGAAAPAGAGTEAVGGYRKSGNIIDIRQTVIEHSIKEEILEKLQPEQGQEKKLPSLILYDAEGLKLFEKITYLDQYYPTNAEIEVLEQYAESMAELVPPNALLIELGSGNLRKINILLQAFERAKKPLEYYALDLSLSELERTLAELPTAQLQHVKCFGLFGTYDDGLEWIQRPEISSRDKCIISLGSSIGNFSRQAAADFLAGFSRALQPGDSLVVGLDGCKDADKVYHAYNDRDGVTHAFYRNGLRNANSILESDAFVADDWQTIGEYNAEAGRHQAFYSPVKDLCIGDIKFRAGEKVRVEESHKYDKDERTRLWGRAGLVEHKAWPTATGDYHLHLLMPNMFAYGTNPKTYAHRPVPSVGDWEQLWGAWDTVTRGMIPDDELLSKPIKLRNCCLFYLGHIPTFLDIHLTRATGGESTEPKEYTRIFERGIDPDVDDPAKCHNHSEVPETYPPISEILQFQRRVRERVVRQYTEGAAEKNVKLSRALWLAFEHEVMHLETVLYMLLQSDKALPPPSCPQPDFESLAKTAKANTVPNRWFTIPATTVDVGVDPESKAGNNEYFVWDNEIPRRRIDTHDFEAQARPITNGEYALYLEETELEQLPASWIVRQKSATNGVNGVNGTNGTNGVVNGVNGVNGTNGTNGILNGNHTNGTTHTGPSPAFLKEKFVKTVFGPVPLSLAVDWPVMASYDELAAYAKWAKGRIPTADEVRSIYEYAERMKVKEPERVLGRTISAVNGHLSNEGVEETPPSAAVNGAKSGSKPDGPAHRPLFTDLKNANVGFTNWHPTPVTQNGNSLAGRGDFGGAWEWTSTPLVKHDGFQPMELYPGYTSDFFDDKHNVVFGGSWATHPRVAGRKSFVNWYQRNYPYAWAGARLVRDV